jgi:hypothetical protein
MNTSCFTRKSFLTGSFTWVYFPPWPIARIRSEIRLAVCRCFFGNTLSSSMI